MGDNYKRLLFNFSMNIWLFLSFIFLWRLLAGGAGNFVAFIITLIIYSISIGISLSPFGEWIFRKLNHVRPLATNNEKSILPFFDRAYAEAKKKSPWLKDDIKLYIVDDPMPNAAALGKKTIFVTSGLYMCVNEDELLGILGHEFGHIAAGDTMALIVSTVGNFTLAFIFILIKLSIEIPARIAVLLGSNDSNNQIILGLCKLMDFLIMGYVFVGTIAAALGSRAAEFEADKYSVNLGYADGLLSFMNKIQNLENQSGYRLGLVQALKATHPKTQLRIGKIEEELQKINGITA